MIRCEAWYIYSTCLNGQNSFYRYIYTCMSWPLYHIDICTASVISCVYDLTVIQDVQGGWWWSYRRHDCQAGDCSLSVRFGIKPLVRCDEGPCHIHMCKRDTTGLFLRRSAAVFAAQGICKTKPCCFSYSTHSISTVLWQERGRNGNKSFSLPVVLWKGFV